MRVTDLDVVLPAGLDHMHHGVMHNRVIVVARITKRLAQIAFPYQHRANTRNVLQDVVNILHTPDALDHQDYQDLAFRIEWPHVGFFVILRQCQAPIAAGCGGPIAAGTRRLIEGRIQLPGVAARCDGVIRLLRIVDVRPYHAVHTAI